MKINLMCDMLVDQGRYIGDDPVGYKCGREASGVHLFEGKWFVMCDHCRELSIQEPYRLETPLNAIYGRDTPEEALAFARERMEKIAKQVMDAMWYGMWYGRPIKIGNTTITVTE